MNLIKGGVAFMRLTVALAVACLIGGVSIADDAHASMKRATNIPAQNLGEALQALAKERDVQVVYFSAAVDDLRTQGVAGELTTNEAIEKLLSGTGLTYRYLGARTVTILPIAEAQALRAAAPGGAGTHDANASHAEEKGAQKKTFWDRFRVAQADAGKDVADRSAVFASDSAASSPAKVEEIVVTANRRIQNAQDVASTLQVFSGADLDRNGADGFEDYLLSVPGASFRDQGNGANRITLRGVSNIGGQDIGDATVSTVGLYLNDVPVQGTSIAPDIALYDLERIEVLQGPQGTLYGEGAMGGAIKMILSAPNLESFESKADLELSSTEEGGFNYRARGAVNLPLFTNRMALRVVGTYLDETGFVDNIARNDRNQDGKKVYSFRGLLGLNVSDRVSAELLAYHNVTEQDDFPQIDSSLPGAEIASTEDRFNDVETSLLGLTIKGELDFAELTSVSSYYQMDRDFRDRLVFGSLLFGFLAPVTQDPTDVGTKLHTFSQELRLVSAGSSRFDWVVGAFYRDKKHRMRSDFTIAPDELGAVNVGLGAAGLPLLADDGLFLRAGGTLSYEQTALYGEGNLELGKGFELTAGLRWFDEKIVADYFSAGFSYVAAALTSDDPPRKVEDHGVIPKFALSYALSDRSLFYVQAAEGFRSGGVNLNQSFGVGDDGASSDSLWSYELGSKYTFGGGRGFFNVAGFFSDWRDVQVFALETSPVTGTQISFVENAGDAEIYGVEAEISAVVDRLALGASAAYTHSELTAASPEAHGVVGSELPNTPQWTARTYAEYRLPVSLGNAFARFDVQYSGRQAVRLKSADDLGSITEDGSFLSSYTLGNLRFGLEASNGWTAALFVQNLWDERAELGRGFQAAELNDRDRISVNRPRTYGVSFSKIF
jgi:outer membrane receptor protein involved in Fe transport